MLGMCVLAVMLAYTSTAWADDPWASDPLDVQGQAALNAVNAQREANGIPAIGTLDQSFASAWCPNEDGGPSGGEHWRVWTPDVLPFDQTTTPWQFAPLHEWIIYDPLYTTLGATITESQSAPDELNASLWGQQECMGLGGLAAILPVQPATTPFQFYAFYGPLGPSATPALDPPPGIAYGETPVFPPALVDGQSGLQGSFPPL
jgi:hypothetical protein